MEMDDRRFKVLMEIAYTAIIEEMHETTERILRYHYSPKQIHKASIPPNMFMNKLVMPESKFLRHMDFKAWGNRNEMLEWEYKRDIKRMEDLIPIVEMLETWFAAKNANTISDVAAEFLGPKNKKTKKT